MTLPGNYYQTRLCKSALPQDRAEGRGARSSTDPPRRVSGHTEAWVARSLEFWNLVQMSRVLGPILGGRTGLQRLKPKLPRAACGGAEAPPWSFYIFAETFWPCATCPLPLGGEGGPPPAFFSARQPTGPGEGVVGLRPSVCSSHLAAESIGQRPREVQHLLEKPGDSVALFVVSGH